MNPIVITSRTPKPMKHSRVSNDPTIAFNFGRKLCRFQFDPSFPRLNSDRFSLYTPSHISFDGICGSSKHKTYDSFGMTYKGSSSFNIRRIFQDFNKAISFHCEKLPLGFASIQVRPGDNDGIEGNESRALQGENLTLNSIQPKNSKKVLILMSDTGGGHRASAEAIKEAFNEQFGDKYEVSVTDLWAEHTPWPFNQLPKSYSFLVKHDALWKMTYYGTAPRIIHHTNFVASSVLVAREIAKGLLKYKPDIIISVHPLMQHVPLRILKSKGILNKIVFTTVVTDLSTCHPTWFHKLVTRCYCPSTEVAKRALKAGLNSSQIKIYGLPVRSSFLKCVRPKDELRKELGMDENLPAALLMGGGEGMGPIEATTRELENTLYDKNLGKPIGQILVICGRNKKLENMLSSIDWKIPVKVKGFVTKMEECMGACDCIITKAGPGTIAEAMIRGLPIILNGFISGQEAGNVPYVVENGCGKFTKAPKEIASYVSEWFGTKSNELKAMSENALKLARPGAVFKIVQDLDTLVTQTNSLLHQLQY